MIRTGFAVTATAALSVLLAPSATAQVDQIALGTTGAAGSCGAPQVACGVSITTSGANMLDPVTLTVDGIAIGQATPVPFYDHTSASASLLWTPPKVGTYTLKAVQGSSTTTLTYSICPNPYTGSGQAVAIVCRIISSAGSGSASGSVGAAVPLLFGSAG